MVALSSAPLRILYITPSGIIPETDGTLFALSRMLRERGEHFMALTLCPPLPTTEIPILDTYGMRWSYLPLPGWSLGAQRASWQALLQRFRPDVVQFAAQMNANSTLHIRRMFTRRVRPAFIIESSGSQPECLLPDTFVWQDLQEMITAYPKDGSNPPRNGHAGVGIPMVSVADPHDHQAILAQCDEMERLLAGFPALHCTMFCSRPLVTSTLSQLSPRVLAAVHFVHSETDWLLAAPGAAGAIGTGGTSTSARLVGAALGLNLAVSLRDEPTLSVLAGLPAIQHSEAYMPSIASRVAEWSHASLPVKEETDLLHSLWHMYHGAKLWIDAAPRRKM